MVSDGYAICSSDGRTRDAVPGRSRARSNETGGRPCDFAGVHDAGVAEAAVSVVFRNVGEQPLTLTLGWGLGNGTRYADAVELLLVDAQGKRSPLQLKEFGFVAGMVYVWHVPLAKGATFSLPVDLADYSSNDETYKLDWRPGLYG